MGTTYSRIYTILQKSKIEKGWFEIDDFANSLKKRKLKDFKVRGEGNSIDDYMKKESIKKLINLMESLSLVKYNSDKTKMSLSEKGKRCLNSEEQYKLDIRSSIKSLLENKDNLPAFSEISNTIQSIKLPNIPDTDTIYEHLKNKEQINLEILRRLLFLFACADGIVRKTSCYYADCN